MSHDSRGKARKVLSKWRIEEIVAVRAAPQKIAKVGTVMLTGLAEFIGIS